MFAPHRRLALPAALACLFAAAAPAQTAPSAPVTLTIDAGHVTARVSPTLYGLMTEEINHAYDGGLYAELVQNRSFEDDPASPVHWSLVQDGGARGAMALDPTERLNGFFPVSLRLESSPVGAGGRVGIANDGFWGIPVRADTAYRASFYAKASPGFAGPIQISLEGPGGTVLAQAQTPAPTAEWRRYEAILATGEVPASAANRLVLATGSRGTVWFSLVSLFPPTWNNRPNGNRIDLMRLMAGLSPAFLRFPGGNYLEGKTVATRFDWKRTLGDLSQRPGHLDDAWRYRSTDGMGLLEFLEWCEDLRMQPVLAVFAGLTLDRQAMPIAAGPALQPFVQEALEEIQYVSGGTDTVWGARRAADGHPAPFPLRYVEVGNEDQFDRHGTYDGRFAQFYDAIKARYPGLEVIATAPVTSRHPDLQDDHYYRTAGQMEADTHHYDRYPRGGMKIFVGEWATREGSPTPDLNAALGDAAWLTGLERNSDLVVMSCYAPLFVNVNPGGMQWRTDLIGYDALHSYGSPSYYVQAMFSGHHGDEVLAVEARNVPEKSWQPPPPRGSKLAPPPGREPAFFFDATRDSARGTIYLKFVNTLGRAAEVRVRIDGVPGVEAEGAALTLSSASPTDTNTISDRERIVPVPSRPQGLGRDFSYSFAPYSVTVLELSAAP